jgi:hypothetical protein
MRDTHSPFPTEPHGVTYDQELETLCRIAAWVGAVGRSEAPLSFTATLIALFIAEGPVSQWLREYARRAGVSLERLFGEKKLSPMVHLTEELQSSVDSGDLPPTRILFSSSSKSMFRAAAQYAHLTGSADEVGVRHLLAAYAFQTPAGHLDQLRRWGFEVDEFGREVAKFLAATWPKDNWTFHLPDPASDQPNSGRSSAPP